MSAAVSPSTSRCSVSSRRSSRSCAGSIPGRRPVGFGRRGASADYVPPCPPSCTTSCSDVDDHLADVPEQSRARRPAAAHRARQRASRPLAAPRLRGAGGLLPRSADHDARPVRRWRSPTVARGPGRRLVGRGDRRPSPVRPRACAAPASAPAGRCRRCPQAPPPPTEGAATTRWPSLGRRCASGSGGCKSSPPWSAEAVGERLARRGQLRRRRDVRDLRLDRAARRPRPARSRQRAAPPRGRCPAAAGEVPPRRRRKRRARRDRRWGRSDRGQRRARHRPS